MKIFIVWGMPLAASNTAQTVCAIEKVANLKKRGNDVLIFAPNILQPLWREGLFNWFLLALYQPYSLFQLFWNCTRFKPDIVHSSSPLVLPSVIICKLLRIPHIVEAHGVLFEDAKLCNMSLWQIKLMKICEIINYKLSSKIIANAPGTKKRIVEQFGIEPEKVEVISNGVNTDLFHPMSVSKSGMGLKDNHNYVCFVGNLLPWQGVQYLISSAPHVLEKCPTTRFLIIGSGMMEEVLIGMVKQMGLEEKFVFTGLVPYENVPKYINTCDLCVAPFIREKDDKMSPLKILEYLACEKPVVTSNIRGAGDLVIANSCGLATNSENPEELAQAIITLLRDKTLQYSMGKNGRRLILENYTWENIAVQLEKVYKSCLIITAT